MLTNVEYAALLERCRTLPTAKGIYLESDLMVNLMATVLDYMLHVTTVERAIVHYKKHHWDEIRTLDDIEHTLNQFSDDKEGNVAAAEFLWGYKYSKRASQLRGLVLYFHSIGVISQEALQHWAATSEFHRDFEGRVKGLGHAVYQWLVMRQGRETIKPDVHVTRFVTQAIGRSVSGQETVDTLEAIASALSIKAYELDWRIWEHQKRDTYSPPDAPGHAYHLD